MVAARALAAPVRADSSFWRCSLRTQPRQFACEGAPLGSRRKRGEWAQAVGRSRGGRTSKIHCLADDRGRPIAFALTPGNVADISKEIWLYANRAQALMFLGRLDAARRLYLKYRGEKNVRGEKSRETTVLEDFAELRKARLTHPLMDEIEGKFSARG
jgi:hypothetical protein